jgi:hypothetical protein
MELPLVESDDSEFFHKDTSRRLRKIAELALCYAAFLALLYFRLLGSSFSSFFSQRICWLVVFTPLFLMDLRNFCFAWYLRKNQDRFQPYDALRYMIIIASEFLYKVLLVLYLAFPSVDQMSLKYVMIPFVAGYIAHFVLGHFVPMEEEELSRPEGCNTVAWLLSELTRFCEFVLIIAVTLKVDNAGAQMPYGWAAALWPVWGVEGLAILLLLLVLPFCLASLCQSNGRALMLTWIVLTTIGFGTCLLLSVAKVSAIMDNNLCFKDPVCTQDLAWAILPWVCFLPFFAAITTILRSRLSQDLHFAWYQAPVSLGAVDVDGMHTQRRPIHVEFLPAPQVMFRITATFYSREPHYEDGIGQSEVGGNFNSTVSHGHSVMPRPAAVSSASESWHHQTMASMARTSVSMAPAFDPMQSIMSARGASYAEFVESEQLCFICYSEYPDAILLECGHAGVCKDCASRLLDRVDPRCPVCRTFISQIAKIKRGALPPKALFSVRAAVAAAPLNRVGSRDMEAVTPIAVAHRMETSALSSPGGPPWPASTKRNAVVVEVMKRYEPPAIRRRRRRRPPAEVEDPEGFV